MTVDTFKQEIAEAVRAYEKFVICLDKTPEDCEASVRSLMEKAINAYESRGLHLRHGIALDKQVTVILSQNDSPRPLCGIYFNLHSPYQRHSLPKTVKPLTEPVAEKHPKVATIERSVRARGARVYVDYLQNILGKTLAAAYSARASDYAGVSTPLSWQEVDRGVRREDFTIRTLPARARAQGDLWAALRNAKGVDLARVERYARVAGV